MAQQQGRFINDADWDELLVWKFMRWDLNFRPGDDVHPHFETLTPYFGFWCAFQHKLKILQERCAAFFSAEQETKSFASFALTNIGLIATLEYQATSLYEWFCTTNKIPPSEICSMDIDHKSVPEPEFRFGERLAVLIQLTESLRIAPSDDVQNHAAYYMRQFLSSPTLPGQPMILIANSSERFKFRAVLEYAVRFTAHLYMFAVHKYAAHVLHDFSNGFDISGVIFDMAIRHGIISPEHRYAYTISVQDVVVDRENWSYRIHFKLFPIANGHPERCLVFESVFLKTQGPGDPAVAACLALEKWAINSRISTMNNALPKQHLWMFSHRAMAVISIRDDSGPSTKLEAMFPPKAMENTVFNNKHISQRLCGLFSFVTDTVETLAHLGIFTYDIDVNSVRVSDKLHKHWILADLHSFRVQQTEPSTFRSARERTEWRRHNVAKNLVSPDGVRYFKHHAAQTKIGMILCFVKSFMDHKTWFRPNPVITKWLNNIYSFAGFSASGSLAETVLANSTNYTDWKTNIHEHVCLSWWNRAQQMLVDGVK